MRVVEGHMTSGSKGGPIASHAAHQGDLSATTRRMSWGHRFAVPTRRATSAAPYTDGVVITRPGDF
jgi:hypothetical protein